MDRTSLIAELNSRGLRDEALTGPLYKRLAQALTGLIQEGLLKPGTALPGERDLAEALKLGRVTVRTAYRDLMTSGALESRHGSGTFVSSKVERMEQSLWRLSSFSADMRSRGRLPAARILSRAVNTPSPEESFLLGLGGDEPVLRLDRLRLADGLPLAIERAVVPVKFLGNDAGWRRFALRCAGSQRPQARARAATADRGHARSVVCGDPERQGRCAGASDRTRLAPGRPARRRIHPLALSRRCL
jgi:GntR family transcriptional regulator